MSNLYAIDGQQFNFVIPELGHMHGLQRRGQYLEFVHALNGACTDIPKTVRDFSRGLVQVQVNRKVQLFRI